MNWTRIAIQYYILNLKPGLAFKQTDKTKKKQYNKQTICKPNKKKKMKMKSKRRKLRTRQKAKENNANNVNNALNTQISKQNK